MNAKEAETESAASITVHVFVWGCLATLLVAVTVAVVAVAWSAASVGRERDLALQTAAAQQALQKCTIASARYEGRVKSFERIMISPQHTAVEAAIDEFLQRNQGQKTPLTFQNFRDWFRVTH